MNHNYIQIFVVPDVVYSHLSQDLREGKNVSSSFLPLIIFLLSFLVGLGFELRASCSGCFRLGLEKHFPWLALSCHS
jgi:hypothetical protein